MLAVEGVAAGFVVLVALVLHLVVLVGLWLWARAVARRHRSGYYAAARWLPAVAAFLLGAAYGVSVFQLVRAFGAVASADASSKATLMARGISDGMYAGTIPALLAVALLALSTLSSLVGTFSSPSVPSESTA